MSCAPGSQVGPRQPALAVYMCAPSPCLGRVSGPCLQVSLREWDALCRGKDGGVVRRWGRGRAQGQKTLRAEEGLDSWPVLVLWQVGVHCPDRPLPALQVVFATPGMLHAGQSLQIFRKWAGNEKNMVRDLGSRRSSQEGL